MRGKRLPLPEPNGKLWNGSQRSREKGSNTLLRRISDMVGWWVFVIGVVNLSVIELRGL
jgi:hypothetical protein